MNPAGPIRRYSCTSGQPFVHFSRSVNAWIGVPDGGQGSQPLPLGGRQPDTDMSAPCVAHPVDRVGQPQPVQSLLCDGHTFGECEITPHRFAPAVRRSVDRVHGALPAQVPDQRVPGPGVDEQAVPQHNRRSGAGAANVQPPEVRADEVRGRGDHGNASNYFGFRNFGSRRILGCHGDVKAAAAGPPGYRPGARPAASRVPRRPRRAAS